MLLENSDLPSHEHPNFSFDVFFKSWPSFSPPSMKNSFAEGSLVIVGPKPRLRMRVSLSSWQLSWNFVEFLYMDHIGNWIFLPMLFAICYLSLVFYSFFIFCVFLFIHFLSKKQKYQPNGALVCSCCMLLSNSNGFCPSLHPPL